MLLSSRPSTLRWVSDSGTHLVGIAGQLVVLVPYDSPSAQSLEDLLRIFDDVARNGKGASLLLSFVGRPILPPPKARAHIQGFLDRVRSQMNAIAAVVPGEGFGAAAQRGAVTAVLMFARLERVRICATLHEAVAWLSEWTQLPHDCGPIVSQIGNKVTEIATSKQR